MQSTTCDKNQTSHTNCQHGVNGIMIWARLAATGPGDFELSNRESLGKTGSYKVDNDIKHVSNSTAEWLQKNRIKVLHTDNNYFKLLLIDSVIEA